MSHFPEKISAHLSWAHPLIQEWFTSHLGSPTEPQRLGWPSIIAGQATLISAPTGSGKTLAAFLVAINDLIQYSAQGILKDETSILYISPLKALSNDIQINLMTPLHEITQLAENKGITLSNIKVALRTGDTTTAERQSMLKKPPHILVTTPESLYILLTAEKSRNLLKSISTVIVDEIHALAIDKRGAHLSLSLERLEAITNEPLLRIGLSATQKPVELMAHFLTGNQRPLATIIPIGHAKHLQLSVESPSSTELGAVASNALWDEIYDRIALLAQQNRSTLIFANTRRMAERAAHHLAERLGQDQVIAHHGSLSKKLRNMAETRLKNGELKAIVATASLELGIDIGSVDLVCQLGSPRAISVMLQRVGRSGHCHGAISKGHIFVTTRDELLECAALVLAIHRGDLDSLIIPMQPIDILMQQIVATCATGEWLEDDLYDLCKKSFHYSNLSKEVFHNILHLLSEGITSTRGRYGAYLFRDQNTGLLKPRRGCRLSAITNGGAIPETGLFTVIAEPNGVTVGTLDEDFAIESHRGDIILLGSTSWKIRHVETMAGRVIVEDAHGASPNVPFWRGEAPERTPELSKAVAHLRQFISDALNHQTSHELLNWLVEHCKLSGSGAEQLIEYIQQGIAILSAVPTQQRVIAERFFDESGGMQLIIHAPFGARINKAWGLALRKCFCRSFNIELQAAATDDGINISLTEQHSFPLNDVFRFLSVKTIEKVVTQAVLQSPIFPTRWRWDAVRALAITRFSHGKKVPPALMRLRAEDLLIGVFPDAVACQDNLAGRDIELPDHPLVNEALKDSLTEALHLEGLKKVLKQIENKEITCLAIDTPTPSPFAHEILNANPYAFLDDVPLEERRTRAVEMRRILPQSSLEKLGQLEPAVIEEIQRQAWPDIRDSDELLDFLKTVIVFPLIKEYETFIQLWQPFIDELIATKRSTWVVVGNKKFLFPTEKKLEFLLIYPEIDSSKKESKKTREEALVTLLRGWIVHLGPVTCDALGANFDLNSKDLENAFLQLETTGLVLRGHFRNLAQLEWCERRLLARIHRLTLGHLRQQIQPVTALQFVHWLTSWQHLLPGTQLVGEQGLLEVIKQLQGFEVPAKAWEPEIFKRRIKNYDATLLDKLCLKGIIGWGRLSGTEKNKEETELKRVTPTSIAPITFFIREESSWRANRQPISATDWSQLSHVAQHVFQYLETYGASFFIDIVTAVGHLKSEVEMGLWELVARGAATADSFDNLRALIDPHRRLKKKRRRPVFPQYSTGRWSLLKPVVSNNKEPIIETICWLLLKRYGVIFREVLYREKNIPPWRNLLGILRRMEERGEIRGGRFVDGFIGEQFALPYAVDSLRAIKNQSINERVMISAADPLNLLGIILPGPRISAASGTKINLLG